MRNINVSHRLFALVLQQHGPKDKRAVKFVHSAARENISGLDAKFFFEHCIDFGRCVIIASLDGIEAFLNFCD
ncbi:MAG: hypothetical protein UEX93_09080 [Peptococcaceae bacterium]|nr:hypothetical protein [Peptococcaceae bacterium]